MQKNVKKDVLKMGGVFCTEELLSKSGGNIFQLVRIAANRALELASGKPALIAKPFSDKSTTLALEEISQGKIVFLTKKNKAQKLSEENKAD